MLTKTSNAPESPLTKEQALAQLQDQQLNGTAETVTGNVDDSHEFAQHDAHLLQVKLTTRTNNAETKQYEDVSSVVALSATDYEHMEKNESFLGYDSVEILHDPRPKARQKADETGDVKTGSEMEAKKPLRSLQDAQMRFKELTGDDAPADRTFTELKGDCAFLETKEGRAAYENHKEEAAKKAADAAK